MTRDLEILNLISRQLVFGILILATLVAHSLAALPRWRAVAFWVSVFAYAAIAGPGVRIAAGSVAVPAPDAIGWAIVIYLAWWIGGRWTYLVAQVALASIFLGALGWAIEGAAATQNLPGVGAVEWFFAGIDFLLPFAAISGRWRWRWWTLLFFPVHFAGHLLPDAFAGVAHGAIVLIVAAIALRTTLEHKPFSDSYAWVPTVAFTLIMIEVAVAAVTAQEPRLLVSLGPAALIWGSVLRGVRLRWLRRHWVLTLIGLAAAAVLGLLWIR